MIVTAIAATQLIVSPDSVENTAIGVEMDYGVDTFNRKDNADIDVLHEFAGRACYKSFDKPNPATEKNEDYLGHIIDVEHVSVLEHGQVSLYVENVSRSLLLELERHGRNSHLSFSVESQRYVSTSKHHPMPVVPPLFKEHPELKAQETLLIAHYRKSLAQYDLAYTEARHAGIPVKQAREAARAFLPNCTPVDFVVTADIRGWREVIAKRDIDGADKEIRAFANAVEAALIAIAPNSMQ